MTGAASVVFFAPLANYLEVGIGNVEGWLSPTTASIIAELLLHQVSAGLRGDVCEIGVHHGRLFLILANATIVGERAVAVDVFGDQEKNVDHSGSGDRTIFERHVAQYAPGADVEIIQESSLDLEQTGFLAHRFRFMSIDGGHTAQATANDLRLAERTLLPGGVAALDDILNYDWTGVLTGLAAYMQAGGRLVPFALLPNKLLLTTGQAEAAAGRALLLRHFPLAVGKRDLEFMGGPVDSFTEHAYYSREAHAGLRRELHEQVRLLDDARRERDAARHERDLARRDRDEARSGQEDLAWRLTVAEADAASLRASTSWRVTAPLRSLAGIRQSALR